MNKNDSKYFNTALLMDEALLILLEHKDYEYITVKEVCQKAGVNRSTFYLHYEKMDDLLKEAIAMINKKFYDHFDEKSIYLSAIQNADKEHMILITPKYLKPYLCFIKENKKVFKLICSKPYLFETEKTLRKMYKEIFDPILDKFEVPSGDRTYLFAFYLSGISSIITEWISKDCMKDENDLIRIIIGCVLGRSGVTYE